MGRLIALLFLLSGCGLMPDEQYVLDGVPITLENGNGPEKDHFALAVQLYRQEAADRWQMDETEELTARRSLRQVRWTNEPVLNRADYREDVNIIYANWLGCVLRVPFYRALTEHYVGVQHENCALTEQDTAWVQQLEHDYVEVVCNGDESRWPW